MRGLGQNLAQQTLHEAFNKSCAGSFHALLINYGGNDEIVKLWITNC